MRNLIVVLVFGFGCQFAYALKECTVQFPGPTEHDGQCFCKDVEPDELYDSKKYCFIDYPSTPSYPPPSPASRPSGNNRVFILVEPLRYEVGTTGVVITVPAGFVTDYASIPRRLWSVYSPHDQYSRAAIVHDYLYWSQLCSRKQADNLFMIAMKESNVPFGTREAVYRVVKSIGGFSWSTNAEERKKKLPKVVPLDRADFAPNESWEDYRPRLFEEGVRDPDFTDKAYCALGNSTDVPSKESAKKILDDPKGVERIEKRFDPRSPR